MKLNREQRDELEYRALQAFAGSLNNLVNGFRIMGSAGQVVAVYWNDNNPGNDIEIAICPNRLTDNYDLRLVQRWIGREQRAAGRACNVHKHGSEWPIMGFSYADAIAFMARCLRLRRGFLAAVDIDALKAVEQGETEGRSEILLTLGSLFPVKKYAVIDLVRRAGVETSNWYINMDGSRCANPRSNPAYCFNWTFGGGANPIVACLWHDQLKIENDEIVFRGNILARALRLEEVAKSSGEPRDIKSRAANQARRARALDEALKTAKILNAAVRVIANIGEHRGVDAIGHESSVVDFRLLDPVEWLVDSYDSATGEARLVRKGSGYSARPVPSHQAEVQHNPGRFVDQYTIGHAPLTVSRESTSYLRSRAVRDAALQRADGFCEFCGTKGFATRAGSIFLETHHVIPLSEGGLDAVENVAAICPNDHRLAHYGCEGDRVREYLLGMLAEVYDVPQVELVANG
jgi:5-methylcytosine-specific restriction protein A